MALPSPKTNHPRMLFLVLSFIVMVALLANILSSSRETIQEVKYSEFKAAIENPAAEQDRIVEATFQDNNLVGVRVDHSKVKTYVPNEADTRRFLEEHGVILNYLEPDNENFLKSFLIQMIPMIFILIFIFIIMRSVQTGGGKAMSFGKSRAKLINESKPKITFKDVAGIEEAKWELQEIIAFLKDPKRFTRLGGRIPKGVLLIGQPGTGKTILAKGVAGEAGVPFFSISGSDFVEMFVGVGASRVRDLFDQAKKNSPCIVFIDEIDAVGRHRGAGMGGGHDEREQTLNQLLVEMDGFEANEGVIVVAATNRADVLDPALLRPGRFDRRVHVPPPDVKGRKSILEVHTRKTPLSDDVDLAVLAQSTPGFTGADLENLSNEAALIAARKNCSEVAMQHYERAKDKVLMGAERRTMILSEPELRNTAYHEVGHALCGLLTPGCDPVHKITIIPRGQALGMTVMLPKEDRTTITASTARGMIIYAMGGRAAEELMFQERSSGASDDLRKATSIARHMICQWGMSDKIGPLAVGKKDEEVFMGRGVSSGEVYSEKVAQDIDAEIKEILSAAYKTAYELLEKNKDKLIALSEALLIKETLDSRQIDALMQGEDIVTEEEKEAFSKRLDKAKNWRTMIPNPDDEFDPPLKEKTPEPELQSISQAT